MMKIGFANTRDFIAVMGAEDAQAFEALTPDQTAAVAEFQTETVIVPQRREIAGACATREGRGRLCPLKRTEKRGGFRRLRCGGENRLLVGLQNGKRGCEIRLRPASSSGCR